MTPPPVGVIITKEMIGVRKLPVMCVVYPKGGSVLKSSEPAKGACEFGRWQLASAHLGVGTV